MQIYSEVNRAYVWRNSLQGWMLQDGYKIIGAYSTLKGARIAAKKRGFTL